MITQIKLVAATVVLTLMIWVYADLSTHETQQIPLLIELAVTPGSDFIVRLAGEGQGTQRGPGRLENSARVEMVLQMSGSKAALRKLQLDRSRNDSRRVRIPIQVREELGSGTLRPEEIREHVIEWARRNGLQLVDLVRTSIAYVVDRWVHVDAVVEVDSGAFTDQLRGPVGVDPPRVRVSVLAGEMADTPLARGRLVISIVDELRKRPEQDFSFDAVLRDYWTGRGEIRFEPEKVRLTVQRKEGSKRQRLTAIPLHELWPANRPRGQYRIVWTEDQDLVQHIDVLVPAGKSRALTSQDVIAFVEVEPEDLNAAVAAATQPVPAEARDRIPREVRFVFAPGFEDVKILPPLPKVRFKVVRVEEADETEP